jgi:hypothetical protein
VHASSAQTNASVVANVSTNVSGGFCQEPADFRIEIAQLEIIGPAPLWQDRTCISGRTCAVDGILGRHLSADRLKNISAFRIAQDGVGLFDATEISIQVAWYSFGPWDELARSSLRPFTKAWQEVRFIAESRPYWKFIILGTVSGWQPKPREVQFLVDVGTVSEWTSPSSAWIIHSSGYPAEASGFTFDAIKLVDGDKTSISSRWDPQGLPRHYNQWEVVFDFSDGDLVLAMDTCGISATVPRFPLGGAVWLVDRSGAASAWDLVPVTASGGEYRLCWCGSRNACDQPAQFQVDFGALDLVGVHIPQHRTCTSGRECMLDSILGHFLSAGDQVAVLETCGVNFHEIHAPVFPVLSSAAGVGKPWAATSSGTTVSFGSVSFIASGGRYRLCWCSSVATPGPPIPAAPACVRPSDFVVDMGELTVRGLSGYQHRTCVAGRACVIEP